MKKTGIFLLAGLFFVLTVLPVDLISQEVGAAPQIMVDISYMKSKSDNYVELEKEMWKPLHQSRVEKGEMLGWYLYEVTYPYGSDRKYDYVTMNVYYSPTYMRDAQAETIDAHALRVHPEKSLEEIAEATQAARDMVWGEVFYFVDRVLPANSGQPAAFIKVNFMKVDEGSDMDYVDMEKKFFKPVHTAAAEEGVMTDWNLLSRTLPAGSGYDYQYLTIDHYASAEVLNQPADNSLWMKVHGDKSDPEDILHKIQEVRKLTRQETWKLVDFVTADIQ